MNFHFQGEKIESIEMLLKHPNLSLDSRAFLNAWFDDSDSLMVKTSGSTGKPKLLRISKSAMRASAQATIAYFDLKPMSRVVNFLSTAYIAGKMMWVRALEGNWDFYQFDSTDDLPKNRCFDFTALVPLQVYKTDHEKLEQFEKILIGGGVYDERDLTRFKAQKPQFYASFGMTETLSHVAIRSIFPAHQSYYQAIPGVHFETDQGALVIHADHILSHALKTTDEVELLDNRRFIWKGRSDFVINSGGIKMHPELLEPLFKKVFDGELIILGMEDEWLGERMVLVKEQSELEQIKKRNPSESEIERFKDLGLNRYQWPKQIFSISEFPRTETKKIQRQKTLDLILRL